MSETLESWVNGLVEATTERSLGQDTTPGEPGGRVEFGQGKKTRVPVEVRDGRFLAPTVTEGEADVMIPVTKAQLDGWISGELRFSTAFMRGDLKPVGATGPLVAALEVLDDPAVREGVAQRLR